jgi:hypothetical protein
MRDGLTAPEFGAGHRSAALSIRGAQTAVLEEQLPDAYGGFELNPE